MSGYPKRARFTSKEGVGVALGVFAKHWTPGRSKTRLAATIGPERAAEAGRLFLETTVERLSEISGEKDIAFTPSERLADFTQMLAGKPWGLEAQPSGTLGDRMHWFFDQAFSRGHQAVVIVGADSPDMPTESVERAIALLTGDQDPRRAVLGPTEDGGYWLVGARGEAPPIFDELPWSTPELLQATLRRLRSRGWREGADYELIEPWSDVDNQGDLSALRERLAGQAAPSLVRLASALDTLLRDETSLPHHEAP